MKAAFTHFEQTVVVALIAMLAFVVLVSTVELGYLIVKDLLAPPFFWMEADALLEVFSFFLLILIGVELIESLRAYLAENVVHVEVVLDVALIAIARKVIVLDMKAGSGGTVAAIAALIAAIGVAYYVIKKAGGLKPYAPAANPAERAPDSGPSPGR